jgi:hypothetical protein
MADPRELLYRPERQSWTPAKPDLKRGLPGGRCWFGWNKADGLPAPGALERLPEATFEGMRVKLGDGNEWIVPNGTRLPVRFVLDDAGIPVKLPTRAVEAIHARTLWAFEKTSAYLRDGAPIPWKEGLDYCAFMLGLNYRVNLEICLLLELFNEESIGTLMARSTDLPKLMALCDAPAATG